MIYLVYHTPRQTFECVFFQPSYAHSATTQNNTSTTLAHWTMVCLPPVRCIGVMTTRTPSESVMEIVSESDGRFQETLVKIETSPNNIAILGLDRTDFRRFSLPPECRLNERTFLGLGIHLLLYSDASYSFFQKTSQTKYRRSRSFWTAFRFIPP